MVTLALLDSLSLSVQLPAVGIVQVVILEFLLCPLVAKAGVVFTSFFASSLLRLLLHEKVTCVLNTIWARGSGTQCAYKEKESTAAYKILLKDYLYTSTYKFECYVLCANLLCF